MRPEFVKLIAAQDKLKMDIRELTKNLGEAGCVNMSETITEAIDYYSDSPFLSIAFIFSAYGLGQAISDILENGEVLPK